MPDSTLELNLRLGDPVQVYSHITRSPIAGDHIVFQIGDEALDGKREPLGPRIVKVQDTQTGALEIVAVSRLLPKGRSNAL